MFLSLFLSGGFYRVLRTFFFLFCYLDVELEYCYVILAVKLLNSRNALISCSACHAIGEIGRNGPLPLPAGLEKMEQG